MVWYVHVFYRKLYSFSQKYTTFQKGDTNLYESLGCVTGTRLAKVCKAKGQEKSFRTWIKAKICFTGFQCWSVLATRQVAEWKDCGLYTYTHISHFINNNKSSERQTSIFIIIYDIFVYRSPRWWTFGAVLLIVNQEPSKIRRYRFCRANDGRKCASERVCERTNKRTNFYREINGRQSCRKIKISNQKI